MVWKVYATWRSIHNYMRFMERMDHPVRRGTHFQLWVGRQIFCLFAFLWFKDLEWTAYRRLLADARSVYHCEALLYAYSAGFRSLRTYYFHCRAIRLSRLALPQGGPILALPEGSQTLFWRELRRIGNEAQHGSGFYEEIYDARYIRLVREYRDSLSLQEQQLFADFAESCGIDLSDAYYDSAIRTEADFFREVYSD